MIKRLAHYVLSTHWDREWYQTFEGFRFRLVDLLDGVLKDLEEEKLKGPFYCDGQAVIIDDFLEIRPEKKGQILALLKKGKLVAGPWYVSPDEFLVSGEALVRNLEMGMERVCELGGNPSHVGFVCDLFGHISQLPQIFRGFGLKAAIVWRGINPRHDARFLWAGADGVPLPAFRFGRSGYCDYTYKVRHSEKPDVAFEPEAARKDLRAFLVEELERTGSAGPGLIFDGGDHLRPDPEHYRVLLQEAASADRTCEIVHSSLDAFVDEMVEHFDDVKHTVQGELREPSREPSSIDNSFLIPGVGSSRVWIKQENAACQTLLTQWAEPFSWLAARWTGHETPAAYLKLAWRWLLLNHPHDSICGCSIDQVHEDMRYRFSQARQIAREVTDRALRAISLRAGEAPAANELRVVVFNSLARPRNEIVELELEIPAEWQEFGEFFVYETKPAFRIYLPDGTEVPYQRLSQRRNQLRRRIQTIKYPQTRKVHEVRVALPLSVPALGYLSLTIRGELPPGTPNGAGPAPVLATRHAEGTALYDGSGILENDTLRVKIGPTGTIEVTDKRNGEIYRDLLLFEDAADIGDGWNHGPPANDAIHFSNATAAGIEVIENGWMRATVVIRQTLSLPARFDFAAGFRSGERVKLEIENWLTLHSDRDCLEVETKIVNTVADHRLRVLFPTHARTETFLSDAAFDVVERPVAINPNNYRGRELEVESKPQQSWTAVHSPTRGLAVVCDGGLLESGVRDVPSRPIILTLYRSTGRTVFTSGEPGGQLLGSELKFTYRIVPLGRKFDAVPLFHHAQDLAGGFNAVQLRREDYTFSQTPRLPAQLGGLKITGPAILTSLRGGKENVQARVFNPTRRASKATFEFDAKPDTASLVTLASVPEEPLETRGLGQFEIGAKQIRTIEVILPSFASDSAKLNGRMAPGTRRPGLRAARRKLENGQPV